MEAENWYPIGEIARRSGLSERALADAARANKLISYKVHGRRVVRWHDFEDYMKQFRNGPVRPEPKSDLDAKERLLRQAAKKKARPVR